MTTALAPRPAVGTLDRPTVTGVAMLRPVVKAAALLEAHRELALLVNEALKKDTDYGVIPGTGTKPTLLKAGAERLATAFGLRPEFDVLQQDVDHFREVTWTKRKKQWRNAHRGDREFSWQEETGTSIGFYRYVVRCRLISRESGEEVGQGIGSCSTLEGKYIDRPRESENTALKMGKKRALVDAILTTLGLSDRFTQDVEDLRGEAPAEAETQHAAAQQEETGEAPTDKQVAFFAKLLASRVWTPEERAELNARAQGATKRQMTALIDETAAEGHRRKRSATTAAATTDVKGDAAED